MAALFSPFEPTLMLGELYDHSGKALRPTIPVENAAAFPAPTLEAVQDDVERLVEYLVTREFYRRPDKRAINNHAGTAILAAVKHHYANAQNTQARLILVRLAACANARTQDAEAWLLSCVKAQPRALQFDLLFASVHGISHAAVFDLATSLWSATPRDQRRGPPHVLTCISDPRGVEWVERNVEDPIVNAWGEIAAVSGIDWSTAKRWIESGRPLSLVALDALWTRENSRSSYWRGVKRKPFGAPDLAEAQRFLKNYEKLDPVLRVQELVHGVLFNWSEINTVYPDVWEPSDPWAE